MNSYGKSTNCDKLWRVWYGILISTFHVFLVYVGINRYLAFKSQAFDAKFGGDWNQAGMNFTLAMLISALVFLCLFLFICFTRTSNYANEGTQIGRDTDNLHLLSNTGPSWRSPVPMMNMNSGLPMNGGLVQRAGFTATSEDDRISAMGGEELMPGANFDTWSGKSGANQELLHPTYSGFTGPRLLPTPAHHESVEPLSIRKSASILWHRIQRHFLPYANILHLAVAYCLVLPIPVIHTQQIYHRALPTEYVWRSDVDILFGYGYFKAETSAVASPINSKPDDYRQNSIDQQVTTAYFSQWDNLRAMSPEFFNLALVFMLLGLRYPSVFWYTNRAFSFVFSLLLLLVGLHVLVEFSAASVLVKLACNRDLLAQHSWVENLRLISVSSKRTQAIPDRKQEVKTGKLNDEISTVEEINPLQFASPLILSTVGTLIFLCLFVTIFEYGYRQFTENLATYRHYLVGSTSINGFGPTQVDPYLTGDVLERRSNGPGAMYNTNNTTDSVHSVQNGSGKSNPCLGASALNTQLVNGSRRSRHYTYGVELLHPAYRCCFHAYAPHICGLLGSLVVLAFKIPIMWDCVQVYRNSRHPLMLASPLLGIIVSCAWFIVWFAFSLKPAWKFQVNLPLQTITGHVQPVYPNMNANSNGVLQPPIMMGSLLRHSGFGSTADRFSHPIMGTLHTPSMQQAVAMMNSQPMGNCFTTDDGSGHPVAIPASPVYACFHEQAPGYYGTGTNGLARAIRLPPNMEFEANVSSSGLVGLNTLGNGARSVEYYSEDTEASSGRQSGVNNYVCLQSALGSPGCGHATHGILVPTDGTNIMTRLLHTTTPTPPPLASPAPQMNQPPLPALPNSPQHTYQSANTQASRASGPLSLSPPSSGQGITDEDDGSTKTVQQNPTRSNSLHQCSTPSTTSFGLMMRRTGEDTDKSMLYPGSDQRIECSNSYVPGTSTARSPGTTGLITRYNTSVHRQSPLGTNLGPRVTFKENVNTIANVSPNTSDPGSQNTSSNDSGIDNLKVVDKNNCNGTNQTTQNCQTMDSSGTYDNTFTPTVRSSLVIRSPSQVIGHCEASSGTLPRGVSTSHFPSTSGQSMNASVYSNHQPSFGSQNQSAEQTPLFASLSSDLGTRLKSPNISLTTTRLKRQCDMIGDGASSIQSSSTSEAYPLGVSSSLLSDETNEPRLCSQV